MSSEINQDNLRGDGLIPIINIRARNLAEATHSAILACYSEGMRVETPKHAEGVSLGYDADITIRVDYPDEEPKIYSPGIYAGPREIMQYILEVTHGIYNHLKRSEANPTRWGYTYNERFNSQIPYILARIKKDMLEKGRITGRDYQFNTWRHEEDSVLEQEDPPCLQRGQFRFVKNKNNEVVMNYLTDWRSRDLLKAWNENNLGQIELMRLFKDKVSDMLGITIKLGAYIDHSSSLHLYGLYVDRDNLSQQIKQMKQDGYNRRSMALEDYLEDRKKLKRIIAAQIDAANKGYGLMLPEDRLKELGYNLECFTYPKEWDSWPESWNAADGIYEEYKKK